MRETVDLGSGRCGRLLAAAHLADFAAQVKQSLGVLHLQVVGQLHRPVQRVAVACGAAGTFLEAARSAGCDLLLTGETNLHTCYEARSNRMALILAGHYATERFHLDYLAGVLQKQFSDLAVWSSREEDDPLTWL
jgi:putative NIF3 family GTP cyclohydrolase 1 type 2